MRTILERDLSISLMPALFGINIGGRFNTLLSLLLGCSSSESASLLSLSSKISETIAEVKEFVIVALLH